MSSKKHRKQKLQLSDRLYPAPGEGDVDPRRYFSTHDHPKPDRKARQLCAQAQETLNATLAGECSDPVLQDLFVARVEPKGSSHRLLVTIELSSTPDSATAAQALERLERARGLLRSAVAAAICRRRTPDLEFRVAPRVEQGSKEVPS